MSTKKCLYCDNIITLRKKFCNSSCAAKHNNTKRIRTEESKAATSSKMKGMYNKFKGVEKLPRVVIPCYICGTGVRVIETYAHQNHTCKSIECISKSNSIGGKKSAASRVTRSKDEIALYELCKNHYPSAFANYIISDGWDADIVILDHKIAILWNGPWHYKQLNLSNHSLDQVRNRDKIKTQLFDSLGWRVYIFEDRYYTPAEAFVVVRDGTAPPSITYEVTASL